MRTFSVENKLSVLHEKEYVLLTGNATAGIYLSLSALGLKNKKVALPNNICINVPIAVNMSDNSPKYLDISEDTLGLSPEALKNKIDGIDAVIAVHSYGSTCAIKEIRKACKTSNVPLIEDFAVAQGAKIDNQPVGSFGDVSITSFGVGKIIDTGYGGAILTNDRSLFSEVTKAETRLNINKMDSISKIGQLSAFYKQLYNDHYGKDVSKYIPAFQRKIESSKKAFLSKFDDSIRELILIKLNGLEDNIRRREENGKKFKDIFTSRRCKEITVFNPSEGSVYWRFNIFINKNRDNLLKYLLRKKYKVSSWYPSIDIFFKPRTKDDTETPLSDRVSDSILNLWVNQEIDDHYINDISDDIVSFAEGERR